MKGEVILIQHARLVVFLARQECQAINFLNKNFENLNIFKGTPGRPGRPGKPGAPGIPGIPGRPPAQPCEPITPVNIIK